MIRAKAELGTIVVSIEGNQVESRKFPLEDSEETSGNHTETIEHAGHSVSLQDLTCAMHIISHQNHPPGLRQMERPSSPELCLSLRWAPHPVMSEFEGCACPNC